MCATTGGRIPARDYFSDAKRRTALIGTQDEFVAVMEELLVGNVAARDAYEQKKQEFGEEALLTLLRRLLLQVTDGFWLEQLDPYPYIQQD